MLDTLLLAIVSYNVYSFAVVDWGNAKALDLPTWYVHPFTLSSEGLIVETGPSG
jgi:hypothetical protein